MSKVFMTKVWFCRKVKISLYAFTSLSSFSHFWNSSFILPHALTLFHNFIFFDIYMKIVAFFLNYLIVVFLHVILLVVRKRSYQSWANNAHVFLFLLWREIEQNWNIYPTDPERRRNVRISIIVYNPTFFHYSRDEVSPFKIYHPVRCVCRVLF